MKRFAAHYIFLTKEKCYKQHYIELESDDCMAGVYPLENEVAETVFRNGVLFPVSKALFLNGNEILNQLKKLQMQHPDDSIFDLLDQLEIVCSDTQVPVDIYQLDGIDLPAAKLGTNDSRCNCYVQRL